MTSRRMHMNIEQMMGRYQRLRQELSIAYNQQPWHSGRIDRLTLELAQVEREIGARQYEAPRHAHESGARPSA